MTDSLVLVELKRQLEIMKLSPVYNEWDDAVYQTVTRIQELIKHLENK